MAKSKHSKHKKLNTRIGLTDLLFIDRKIRGCEVQLIKIENKLVRLKSRTGIFKLFSMRRIEQLIKNQRDYEKLLKNLEREKSKRADRQLILNDALEDIKNDFNRFAGKTAIQSTQEPIPDCEIFIQEKDSVWYQVN